MAADTVAQRQHHLQQLDKSRAPSRQTQTESMPPASVQDFLKETLGTGESPQRQAIGRGVHSFDKIIVHMGRTPGFPAQYQVRVTFVGSRAGAIQTQQRGVVFGLKDKAKLRMLHRRVNSQVARRN